MPTGITAVVLAGGMGTRIRALFPDVPKPMIPVAGEPFLHWTTAHLAHNGICDFIYSTGYKSEQIARWCEGDTMPGLRRRCVAEAAPLGTGGGILNCLPLCGDWLLATNGDSLCLGGVRDLVALVDEAGIDGALVGLYESDTSRYGSLDIGADGWLAKFREKAPGQGYINGGTYLFRKRALQDLGVTGVCSVEVDLIPKMLAGGQRIQVVQVRDAPFIDIGTPDTAVQGDHFIQRHSAAFTW